LLTHIHPDHSGSARELARAWDLPVHVHPRELPLAAGRYLPQYANPLDRWLIAPLLRFAPARRAAASQARSSLEGIARALGPDGGVPGLPDWECVPTPGHTPGHVSYFRARDRVLITGDAVLTVNARSLWGTLGGQHQICGPPRISTWDRTAAARSITRLAGLGPEVLAPGHGTPMTTGTAAALRSYARSHDSQPGLAAGFLRPVDYTRRTGYRRPPGLYLRFQRLGILMTAAGISPAYVITLEVPGRRSGVIRRTVLVRVACGSGQYLVALAGESDWVRNVRAAGGQVVIGRRHRQAVTLAELPDDQRAPIIHAYLMRAGRSAGSRAVAREARYYFGVSASPSLEEIGRIARHYPVFRITDNRDPPAAQPAHTASPTLRPRPADSRDTGRSPGRPIRNVPGRSGKDVA